MKPFFSQLGWFGVLNWERVEMRRHGIAETFEDVIRNSALKSCG